MKYPIYILSKGRHEKPLTAKCLMKYDQAFKIFVEPQDEKPYKDKFGSDSVHVISENNKGIAYVRNCIKDYSIEQGDTKHWQLDDNIKSFRRRENNKNVLANPIEMLEEVEEHVDQYSNIGIAGLKHILFAWSANSNITNNVVCYSCVLVNNILPIRWCLEAVEDVDYSLQVLKSGYCTLLFNRLVIEKLATGQMKGGCAEIDYAGDNRLKRYVALQKKYPGRFEITEQYGRAKLKPSRIWKSFPQQPQKIKDELFSGE